MDGETRRSPGSVASVVLACCVMVPVVAGIAAVIVGLAALVRIERSGGRLGGRKLAIIGIVLGCVHSAVLAMVLVLDAAYVVEPGATALVTGINGHRVNDAEGLHLKLPILEDVRLYRPRRVHQEVLRESHLLLANRSQATVDVAFRWRACDVGRLYLSTGGQDRMVRYRLEAVIEGALRNEFGRSPDLERAIASAPRVLAAVAKYSTELGVCMESVAITPTAARA